MPRERIELPYLYLQHSALTTKQPRLVSILFHPPLLISIFFFFSPFASPLCRLCLDCLPLCEPEALEQRLLLLCLKDKGKRSRKAKVGLILEQRLSLDFSKPLLLSPNPLGLILLFTMSFYSCICLLTYFFRLKKIGKKQKVIIKIRTKDKGKSYNRNKNSLKQEKQRQ